jgi:hypothetical protein
MASKNKKKGACDVRSRKAAVAKKSIQDSKRLLIPKVIDGDEGSEIPAVPTSIEEVIDTKQFIDQSKRRVMCHVVKEHVSGLTRCEYRGIISMAQQMGQHRQEQDVAFAIMTIESDKQDKLFNSKDLIKAFTLFSEKAAAFKENASHQIRRQAASLKPILTS